MQAQQDFVAAAAVAFKTVENMLATIVLNLEFSLFP